MFPRRNRLSARDIALFWGSKNIRRRQTSLFTVYCAKTNVGYNRCTVVVGSKVDRRAAKRNAIKRRLRAMLAPWLKRDQEHDVIIVVSPKIREAGREEIAALIAEAAHSLGLTTNNE